MRYPSHSFLSGQIPSELGGITELVSGGDAWNSCFLVANELTSSLPTQLGNLVKMETRFRAHENALSSTVPTELGNLGLLEVLYLDNNSTSIMEWSNFYLPW